MRTRPASGGSSAPGAPADRHDALQPRGERAEFLERPVLLRAARERMNDSEVLPLGLAVECAGCRPDAHGAMVRDLVQVEVGGVNRAVLRQRGEESERKSARRRRETPRDSPRTRTRSSRSRAVRPSAAAGIRSRRPGRARSTRSPAPGPRNGPVGRSPPRSRLPGSRLFRHSSAGSETIKSPIAPGRMISLRTPLSIAKQLRRGAFYPHGFTAHRSQTTKNKARNKLRKTGRNRTKNLDAKARSGA